MKFSHINTGLGRILPLTHSHYLTIFLHRRITKFEFLLRNHYFLLFSTHLHLCLITCLTVIGRREYPFRYQGWYSLNFLNILLNHGNLSQNKKNSKNKKILRRRMLVNTGPVLYMSRVLQGYLSSGRCVCLDIVSAD